jgi:hypothetical protein
LPVKTKKRKYVWDQSGQVKVRNKFVYNFFGALLVQFRHFLTFLVGKEFRNLVAGYQSSNIVEKDSFLEISGIA